MPPFRQLTVLFLLFTLLLAGVPVGAQLCTGSLGDPVVNITFGAGNNPGSELGPSITSYSYATWDCPQDGFYSLRNQTSNCFNNTWHTVSKDHTGDPGGYFMLVNASYTAGDFYQKTVDGLCPSTTYEFAAWILNLMKSDNSIKPNITFSIEKTDGTILQQYNTDNIPVTRMPEWKQFGFFFTTPANVNTVVIRMKNNAPGGVGNDLALDDITFRPCGPLVTTSVNGNSGSISLCEGSESVLTLSGSLSSGFTAPVFQWQISTDNGNTWTDIPGATNTTYRRLPTGKGNYLYRLSVAESGNMTISSCRVASNAFTVSVHTLPDMSLSTGGIICPGSDLTLKAMVNYNSLLPGKFNWTYPDPNAVVGATDVRPGSAANSIEITQVVTQTSPATAGKYYLTVQNSDGCSATDSIIASLYPRPNPDFSISPVTCMGQAIRFTNQSTGTAAITQWTWRLGDQSISTDQNPEHIYAVDQTYNVRLIIKDGNGCSDSLSKPVIVHPLPHPDFGLPQICPGDPAGVFTDSSIMSDGSIPGFTYLWNFGDPQATPANPNSSVNQNPVHSYSMAGPYNVQLTVTSQYGCKKDTIKLLTVNGDQPIAAFTIDREQHICSNDPVTIINNASVSPGKIVRVEIFWNDARDPAAKTIDDDPFPGKNYSFDYSALVKAPATDFVIRYVVFSGKNCMGEFKKTITIFKSPDVEFDALGPVCQEQTSFLVTTAKELSGVSGAAVFTGYGISDKGEFNPALTGPGVYQLKYTYTSDNGCSAWKAQTIKVNPQPTVDAGPRKTIMKGSDILLEGSGGGRGVSYEWAPIDFMDDPHIRSPKVAPVSDITYTLKVTSEDGCTNEDSVKVTVLNGIYVPTAFTPNGDGLNDLWRLPRLDSYPETEVWVFDRWGKPVYHSKGREISWDGTANGQTLPAGTFVYYIELKPSGPKLKGTVTLIR